jgi:hypothetical protein
MMHTCLLNIVISPVAIIAEVACCVHDRLILAAEHWSSVSWREVELRDADRFCIYFAESRLEGWLSVPNKQNIRRHGWKKQYVVVSSKKIIFYNSENDKQNTDPVLILDLKWVSQCDVRFHSVGTCIIISSPDLFLSVTAKCSMCDLLHKVM